jgi:hypothetical protein
LLQMKKSHFCSIMLSVTFLEDLWTI